MNIKRELFKQALIHDSYESPVYDEFDLMAKHAADPVSLTTKNVIMGSLPLISAGILLMGAGAGVKTLVDTKTKRRIEKDKEKGFKEMLELYPELKARGIDNKRLRLAYDAYMDYAPSTARHPMIVGQMLAETGANIGLNTQAIKELAAIEKAKIDTDKNRRYGTDLSAYTRVTGPLPFPSVV